jgi:hypothetical protein
MSSVKFGFKFASVGRVLKDWARLRLATPRYKRVYLIYWKIKTHPWSAITGVVLAAALMVIFVVRLPLGSYLVRLDPALLSQLCIGVGAALIGLIAVVFTLSLFVIQQISDRSVPGILREYAADDFIRAIYAALSVLAITCLTGALLPSRHHPVLTFSLPIFCALSSLILLSALFTRVAILSDPSNIILHIWKTGIGEVKRLRVVQNELVRLNPEIRNVTDPLGRVVDNVGAATAALYAGGPFLTKKLSKSLNDLHSLMRHFGSEQQHTLLSESAGAVVHVLERYIELRGSSLTMANTTSFMMGLELAWDSLVVASIETFAALMRSAIESGDTPGAQALIKALGNLACRSVQCCPRGAPPGEQPTTSFIVGYLTVAAKQAIGKRNDDVIMTVNEQHLWTAAALATRGYSSTARGEIEDLSQVGTLAVLGKQQIAATDTTATLLKLLSFFVDHPDVAYSDLIQHTRDVVMQICRTEATLLAKGLSLGASLSASPDTPLRITLSGVSTVSIESIHRKLVQSIANNYSDEKHEAWSRSAHMLEEIDDGLWRLLEEIGLESVSGTESILFYLNQAAYLIGEQLLWLWHRTVETKLPAIDLHAIADGQERVEAASRIHQRERFKDKLEESLSWHVNGFYGRCRKLQPQKANDLNLHDCFASATAIATQALGLGLSELAIDIAETVGTSCTALLKEGGLIGLVESCRRISVLPELGLVALHENANEMMTAIEGALKVFVTQANDLVRNSPEEHRNRTTPVWLVTERLEQIASGQDRGGYFGVRFGIWRPTYTREEARAYLQTLTGALA